LLFPLDDECNWMVEEAIHPGACAVSEAILCAGDRVGEVLDWVFAEQDEILADARRDPKSVRSLLTSRFPSLRGCLGKPAVRARLNRALRWSVKNQLQVLTPQIYVDGLRLCDEDTDLGLEYALTRLIARARAAPGERPEPVEPDRSQPIPTRRQQPREERAQETPRPYLDIGVPEGPDAEEGATKDDARPAPDAMAAEPEPGPPPAAPEPDEPAPAEPPATDPDQPPAPGGTPGETP
jgi:hypothetical protein